MDSFFEEEIKRNYNQAYVLISLFLAAIDTIFYIVIITLFKWNFTPFNYRKQKLSSLIFLDGVLRSFNMYTDEYSQYFIKEVFFCLISTAEFYMIISCLNQIFTDKNVDNGLENDLKIRNGKAFTFAFFILVFSFKGIFERYKLLSTLQYICSIIGIYMLSKYIGGKIEIYLDIINKKNSSFNGQNFVNNMPFFISIYLIVNSCLEMFSLLVENKLYSSYMNMLCKLFKEVGKYLIFILLIIIYHIFNKYIIENDYMSVNNKVPKGQQTEKSTVNVYRDEEEYNGV